MCAASVATDFEHQPFGSSDQDVAMYDGHPFVLDAFSDMGRFTTAASVDVSCQSSHTFAVTHVISGDDVLTTAMFSVASAADEMWLATVDPSTCDTLHALASITTLDKIGLDFTTEVILVTVLAE